MGTIFYNNIELKIFEIKINCYTDDRGMAHKFIANDTENLKKELKICQKILFVKINQQEK